MMNKKGELTTSELIGIIILVVSVAIIIFVYFQINWTGTVDDSVCHESVVLRGTLPEFGGAKSLVPLKCKTDKICIRGDKMVFGEGDCSEEYLGAKGVNEQDVSELNDVNRIIAQEMLSCWQMMGEGKISIFPKDFWDRHNLARPESSCIVCSRIALDESTLSFKGIDLNQIDVQKYMDTHKAPNQNVSYSDYFTGENGKTKIDEETIPLKYTGSNVDEETAVLFMQISADSAETAAKKSMTDLAAVFAGGTYLGGTNFLKLIATKVAAIAGLTYVGFANGNAWVNRNIVAGKCSDISFGEESRTGCSVVMTVPYDSDAISKACDSIESIS
jgi:hypothetical protein